MSTKKIQIINSASIIPKPDWNQTDETKADYIKNKPTLGSLASKSEILKTDLPSDVQDSLNKADTALQSYTESDPTVSSWAKEPNKPTYTADEVGALPTDASVVKYTSQTLTDEQKAQARANIGAGASAFSGSYNDLTNKPTIPSALSDLSDDTTHRTVTDSEKSTWNDKATTSYVDSKVASIVNSAPETLDTLNELAAALGNDPNFATTIATQIGTKVDKVEGKGLSTNDYTDSEKNKLSGIAASAEVNQNTFSNIMVGSTEIAAGSKTDTINIIEGSNITLTTDLTNKKITIAAKDTIYTHPSSHPASMITGLAAVATSGSYNDLSDKPTIPTKTSDLDNDSGFKTTDNNTTYTLTKSGSTITLTGSDGSTTSVSDSDTNTEYVVGTSTTLGTTKLYDTTGTNTDGTITQAKLTELIGDVESLLAAL